MTVDFASRTLFDQVVRAWKNVMTPVLKCFTPNLIPTPPVLLYDPSCLWTDWPQGGGQAFPGGLGLLGPQ
jgi:hypothetical protein